MNTFAGSVLALTALAQEPQGLDLASLEKSPPNLAADVTRGRAVVTSDGWGFLVAPGEAGDAEVEAVFTILEPAKRFRFFGEHWSVWPDLTYGDQGFEVALLLRAGKENGYRVQVSHALQEVALVKYRDGGYLRSVPCGVKAKEPQRVSAELKGSRIVVRVNGREAISYQDDLLPIARGRVGVGASSGAKVAFEKLAVRPLSGVSPASKARHVPNFSARPWLGGRPWVFDGDEPILMLVSEKEAYINNVKLRPGYKPQLSWNSYWETSNQGAFPEGAAKPGNATVTGGGRTLTAAWTARSVKGRFDQRIRMVVGWDERRATYTYDVDGELEVLAGDPFHFRYGYDFEHHTPLDPFQWQYLIVRREGGRVNRRPVYPIDPGPMYEVEQSGGARVWYGRHGEKMLVAPAVEYDIPEAGKRKLNTAVCAAFYDTGVAFAAETAPPGTKVRVKYRYTGWPAEEAEALFKASTVYETPMLDPAHHYIFADEWPTLTFSQFVPMSETWIYGRRPFKTAHNVRPTYALEKNAGAGSGFAMKLGPNAFGEADLPIPAPLPEGRWAVTAKCKAVNVHGPGGRIELKAKDKNGKELRKEVHFVGNGSWKWKEIGFATDLPGGAPALSVGFGNGGTGDVLFTDVAFARLDGASKLSPANPRPPAFDAAPAGALVDFRMREGRGLHVFDAARGPFGTLELANVDWAVDAGRPALRFADPPAGRRDFPRMSSLDLSYLSRTKWSGTPVAISGFHGGGLEVKGLTIATWVKPDARMGAGAHANRGDLVGVGARRFILSLSGFQAPYRLSAALNVNDAFVSPTAVEAGRWSHAAMTCEPTEAKKWRVRLYLDGKRVHEGVTARMDAPATMPPSFILGSEIFYLHDGWYRGLIGRTVVFDRALKEEEVAALARE